MDVPTAEEPISPISDNAQKLYFAYRDDPKQKRISGEERVDRQRLHEIAAEMKAAYDAFFTDRLAERVITVGLFSIEAREISGRYGEWYRWVYDCCPFSSEVAEIFMGLARRSDLDPDSLVNIALNANRLIEIVWEHRKAQHAHKSDPLRYSVTSDQLMTEVKGILGGALEKLPKEIWWWGVLEIPHLKDVFGTQNGKRK